MKKSFIYLFASLFLATVLFSCHRDDDEQTPAATSNPTTGNWTLSSWDNSTNAATGTLNLKADGTYALNFKWNGTATTNTENGTYVLASNNATISFTKTGGDVNYLSGANPWAITTSDAHNLKMTSSYGLKSEFTK